MELHIFGRFHAREGEEGAVAAALRDLLEPTRREPGCLAIHAYQALADRRLFYLHVRWVDQAAVDRHAGSPHTLRFVERVHLLIDHPLDVAVTEPL